MFGALETLKHVWCPWNWLRQGLMMTKTDRLQPRYRVLRIIGGEIFGIHIKAVEISAKQGVPSIRVFVSHLFANFA